MNIEPPFSHYLYHRDNEGKAWKVGIGDIVVLHYKHGAGKALFDVNHGTEQRPLSVHCTMGGGRDCRNLEIVQTQK
jgi:hypothetical protein